MRKDLNRQGTGLVARRSLGMISALLVLLNALPFAVTTACSTDPRTLRQAVLHITLDVSADGLRVTTRLGGESSVAGPHTDATTLTRFRRMYEILERRLPAGDELQTINRQLSDLLITPIRANIDKCSEIVIELHGESLEIPFDLLIYRGKPLFLQRPVAFQIKELHLSQESLRERPSALVVSDSSADPDRACYAVARLFETVVYRDVKEVTPASLRQEAARDLLVLSVHGVVGKDTVDYLQCGEEPILPSDIEAVQPVLVYFDSCRLGLSRPFLDCFEKVGTRYFVAPILSNESGNSSTQTLRTFFEKISQGERPELAMFVTRTKLAQLYEDNDLVTKLWRAFPFRVYRLN